MSGQATCSRSIQAARATTRWSPTRARTKPKSGTPRGRQPPPAGPGGGLWRSDPPDVPLSWEQELSGGRLGTAHAEGRPGGRSDRGRVQPAVSQRRLGSDPQLQADRRRVRSLGGLRVADRGAALVLPGRLHLPAGMELAAPDAARVRAATGGRQRRAVAATRLLPLAALPPGGRLGGETPGERPCDLVVRELLRWDAASADAEGAAQSV